MHKNSNFRGGGTYRNNSYKPKINYCFKILVSCMLAFLILEFISRFYSNMPYSDKDESSSFKVTDYKYEPMENYTYALEGYGHGRINNDGYVNIEDYDSNKEVNILMVGSSQFEAFQVDIKDSVTAKLNEMLENKFVYNIGISSNLFPKSISNISPAISKYNPTDYIILEMADVKYSDKELIDILEKESNDKISSENSGLLNSVKKIIKYFYKQSLFLRLVRRQLDELTSKKTTSSKDEEIRFNEQLTWEILNKIKNTVENKVKVIIVYHPNLSLDSSGNLQFLNSEKEDVERFSKLCQENEIYFLDMSNRFREEYEKNYILPYGFNNTTIGKGHLNKYGHNMIAEELYKIIKGAE